MLLNQKNFDFFSTQLKKTLPHLKFFFEKDCFFNSTQIEQILNHKGLNLKGDSCELSYEKALEEISSLYLENTIPYHHRNYIAHLNCPLLISSIIGDIMATCVNTAVETWDQSTSATHIEQEVINWYLNKLNWSVSHSDGVFTSGGTASNFMSILLARDSKAKELFNLNIKQDGIASIENRFKIFCSEKSHFSIQTSASILGLGEKSVIKLPVDDKMKLDTESLIESIEREKNNNNIPIAIIATLGTTDFGSFDPIEQIQKIAKKYNVWLHVDAAYGGAFILSDFHKHHFQNLHRVNSISVDFHKSFFQPVCTSAFFLKDKSYFSLISHHSDYLNPKASKIDSLRPNLINKSIQTTRRMDALKIWFSLKVSGEHLIKKYLETLYKTTLELHDYISSIENFEFIHTPELSTIVFRYICDYKNESTLTEINTKIKQYLFNKGLLSIGSTKHKDKVYLKFTLVNPENTIEQLNSNVELIKKTGDMFREKVSLK